METDKRRGPKPKEINWDKLDAALQFGARLLDCRGLLDLDEETIRKAIKEKHDLNFGDYRELRMSTMRTKLLQKQFDVAMQGNVAMLIWLGKQHLDQKDKQEIDSKINQIQINIDSKDAKA